jgi:sulfate permease, SulP family
VALSTFIATLAFTPHLDYGIITGIIISIVMFMHRSAHPSITLFRLTDKEIKKNRNLYKFDTYSTNDKILVAAIDWNMSFTNAANIKEQIIASVEKHPQTKYLLILARGINHIDTSAIETLTELHRYLLSKGITLKFSGLSKFVLGRMIEDGLSETVGKDNFYKKANYALKSIWVREEKKKKISNS